MVMLQSFYTIKTKSIETQEEIREKGKKIGG
jgi:hypothetical protein